MMTKPPIGSCWRILVQQPRLEVESGNYKSIHEHLNVFESGGIFDELVILFAPDATEFKPPYTQRNASCLHIEQMDTHDWYLGIGDLKFNIHVEKTGALRVSLYDGETTEFKDTRRAE